MNRIIGTVIAIISGTPWWVWVLLAFLLYRGIRALRPSVAPIYMLFALPAVFGGLSVQTLLTNKSITFGIISLWIGAIAIGSLVGWLIVNSSTIVADKKKWLIRLPGSPLTLILILFFFGVRYYFGYSIAINPELMQSVSFLTTRFMLGGLMSGITLGRTFCFLYKYQKAAHSDLTTEQ